MLEMYIPYSEKAPQCPWTIKHIQIQQTGCWSKREKFKSPKKSEPADVLSGVPVPVELALNGYSPAVVHNPAGKSKLIKHSLIQFPIS